MITITTNAVIVSIVSDATPVVADIAGVDPVNACAEDLMVRSMARIGLAVMSDG
jgi:hypothetical protein